MIIFIEKVSNMWLTKQLHNEMETSVGSPEHDQMFWEPGAVTSKYFSQQNSNFQSQQKL